MILSKDHVILINKPLKKEIRSGNLIIFNSTSIGNLWGSKEARLIIRIPFLYSKFVRCLEFRIAIAIASLMHFP